MPFVFPRYQVIVPDYPLFEEKLRDPLPVHLRVNQLKASPGAVRTALERTGISLLPSIDDAHGLYEAQGLDAPGNLLAYYMGQIHPQALTSCLAALVLQPAAGQCVLDLCAAPGGKTAHLAQLMGNRGLVVANELYASRQVPLGHTLARLGVANTVVTGYQAQEFPLRQRFDRVLADVPCSGEGRFRRVKAGSHARGSTGKTWMTDLQRKIILRAYDLLDEGGRLLYATCTYNPLENEAVVQYLLENREARLIPIQSGIAAEPGIQEWEDERYDRQLAMAARFYPHRVDSVGFFMALIGRP
ncbi:RsmB/NOP family class I SAM-dependent RNA methyltransferase [Desulfatiglans anilini]|uniref:RsmB/NOP family class I SAM-dependent RNA methyltransferase n=1 Tax=Desulfatiglans anilini TaxID=90728 RepID=UPI0004029577|nr:RsmB/NOP family class I SAM-dependent RNA methyltransferase [Desulfatiglans anilini]